MNKDKKISVIIVDDHPYIRKQFASDMHEDEALILIGEASNGVDGSDLICKMKPDIAVIDIHLPEMNGFEIARKVKLESKNTEIVILTGYDNEEYFKDAMDIGVSGYFFKDETNDLVTSIKKIYSGETILSPKVLNYVAKLYKKRIRFREETPEIQNLTNREMEILRLISENKSNHDISSELNIDKRTVETHRNNMREKLGLIGGGRNALLVFALQFKGIIK
jgi:NarL family two-component system response regulator LiaR